MPTLPEAVRYAESPTTTERELRRACGILLLPVEGTGAELRARLARHLVAQDASRPVVCLNPGPSTEPSPFRPLPRPGPGEYAPGFAAEIALVPDAPDFAIMLQDQLDVTRALAFTFGEEHADLRYAADKWSVGETLGHLADCERILSYRLLRVLRGDATPLQGFDHEAYVPAGRFRNRRLLEVLEELAAVRQATLRLILSSEPADLTRQVPVGRTTITGLALAYLIAGHERHHQLLLRERYLPHLPDVR